MRTQRQVVDFALRRRALLRDLYSGRVGSYEVCDASPYLRSAARFHGEPTDVRCPVCRHEHLTNVHYIYGDELKASAGQARRLAELSILAMTYREIQVYVVEVCRGCGWNHLIEQYLLGRDGLVTERLDASAVASGAIGGGVGARTIGGHRPPARGRSASEFGQAGSRTGSARQTEGCPTASSGSATRPATADDTTGSIVGDTDGSVVGDDIKNIGKADEATAGDGGTRANRPYAGGGYDRFRGGPAE